MIIDLHMHSQFSDGQLSIEKLITLYGEAKFDAIAITDHLCSTKHLLGWSAKFFGITLTKESWADYTKEINRLKNRAWRDYRMLLFTGVEYTRNTFSHGRNAHMLAIDIKDFIDPDLPEEEWLTQAKSQGAMTVAAHPLKLKDAASQTYYLWHRRKKFDPLIDIWECANARTMWPEMFDQGLSLIASSDLHTPKKWDSWRTEVKCEKDPQALIAALKDKNKPRDFVFIDKTAKEIQCTRPSYLSL